MTESLREVRHELANTLHRLAPDSDARSWIERLRAACREYLTAIESPESASIGDAAFVSALQDMRAAFLEVSEHVAAMYRLKSASALATEMREAGAKPRDHGS